MCKNWRQLKKYILRYAPVKKCSGTAQRHNIIFSSATLPIEFRIKRFYHVHYLPESNPHTKNGYPSLFPHKVIGKISGKNPDRGRIHSSLQFTYGDGGSWKCNDRHFVIIRLFRNMITCQPMFLKIVIYQNVAFTHANTQKDITELKQRYAICL